MEISKEVKETLNSMESQKVNLKKTKEANFKPCSLTSGWEGSPILFVKGKSESCRHTHQSHTKGVLNYSIP